MLDVRHEKVFETDVTERVKRGFAAAGINPPAMRHHGELAVGHPDPSGPRHPTGEHGAVAGR